MASPCPRTAQPSSKKSPRGGEPHRQLDKEGGGVRKQKKEQFAWNRVEKRLRKKILPKKKQTLRETHVLVGVFVAGDTTFILKEGGIRGKKKCRDETTSVLEKGKKYREKGTQGRERLQNISQEKEIILLGTKKKQQLEKSQLSH